jgi:hypothetical protein
MNAMASRWDAEWHHHDLSNPVLGAATLYAAEAIASLAHHDGDIDAAAVVGALAAGTAAWVGGAHFWLQVYRTVATVVSLAWILYAEHFGPFGARALTAFGAFAIALAALYPAAAFVDRRATRKTDELSASLRRKAERGEWPAMFAMLGVRDVEFVAENEFRAGRTLEFRLPAHGRATFSNVSMLAEKIETSQDLPHGSVKFRRGETGQVFHMDIHTRDVLAEELPMPMELTQRSVNDPMVVGLDEFGDEIELLLREVLTMIFAPRGSGKSNLINVLIELLACCVDVVIWVIDLKGGRVARPWLQPWLDGRTERPVLDWVATTPDEAALMLAAAVTAIDHRSSTGVGEKVTPSARQPAILVIADEGANLTGLRAAGGRGRTDLVYDVINRGRSEAVDMIMAYLRATVTLTGSGDLKSQAQLRIALGAGSSADGTAALDNAGMGAEVAKLKHPGSALFQRTKDEVLKGKVYRREAEDVPTVALACSARRPGLEPDLEAKLGKPYAERWSVQRSGRLLAPERQREVGFDPDASAAETAAAVAEKKPAATALPTIPPPPANAKPAFRTMDGTPIPRKLDDAAVDEMFADLSASLADLDKVGTETHAGRERMLGIVRGAGPDGIGPSELLRQLNAAGVQVVRQTVHQWLTDEQAKRTIVKRAKGDYVAAEHA